MKWKIFILSIATVFIIGCSNNQSKEDSELVSKLDQVNKEVESLKAENEKLKTELETPGTSEDLSVEQEPGTVYYANCTEVREAGADPIHEGEPGYSTKLDRDRDGVACE
ncbi:excalibur calcium-binding domain-containing protein [Cohnella kolymensis]|uniref:excalibur calcium-binding domain-containing protein n=1 Tax=Cohnella kolymensis TaxID=1590652 RepID=UPI002E1332C2